MATPFDVVSKHRTHAWTVFALIMGGFLALCIVTTVWHAHQRRNPPVAMTYISEPVLVGDTSICLTNEWGYFPINLSGISASCSLGTTYQVPPTEFINTTVPLSPKPASLNSQPIFADGVTGFQANEAGCNITQSFRTGLLGDVPKNCFRFATHTIPFSLNTSVQLALAWQSNTFTNSENASVLNFQGQPGSQAMLALFTDGFNSLGSFEASLQAVNSSNWNQLQPSVRTNLKAFANNNHTETFANPQTTPFSYAGQAGAFLSTSTSYVQMTITTSPKGYLSISEQDPLSVWVLLPAYGGFWPYFILAFGLFFSSEPTLGIRPFIVNHSRAVWRKIRPVKAERAHSSQPMHIDPFDSADVGMSDAEKKERAYLAAQRK